MNTMSKKYLVLICFGILFVCNSFISAQTLKLPYKDVGACPFECCTYREWTAKKETSLFKDMNSNSPVVFKVKKGEKVTGMTGVVITSVAGKATVLSNFTSETTNRKFKKGDVLSLLTYLGEGYYQVWQKGKFFEAPADADDHFKILSQPKSVWWVKIKNRKGQIGWTKLADNFDNKDACG